MTRKERSFCVYIGGPKQDKSCRRMLRLSDIGLLENDRSFDRRYCRLVQQEQAHKNVTQRRRPLASKLADGILIAKNRSKGPARICVSGSYQSEFTAGQWRAPQIDKSTFSLESVGCTEVLSIREQPIKITFVTDSAKIAPPEPCTQAQALFTRHR